jgi:hypothetical protein
MGSRAEALDSREVERGSLDPSLGGSFGAPSAYIGWAIGVVIALFVMLAIGRVVLDAANAAARVQELRATNSELRARVDALAAERQLVTSPIFIQVAGRGRGYGAPDERAFGLVPGGPPPPRLLSDDQAGAAGAGPLDAWVTLLLGG